MTQETELIELTDDLKMVASMCAVADNAPVLAIIERAIAALSHPPISPDSDFKFVLTDFFAEHPEYTDHDPNVIRRAVRHGFVARDHPPIGIEEKDLVSAIEEDFYADGVVNSGELAEMAVDAIRPIFKAGFQSNTIGIEGPIPIDQMPEEWKDGRNLLGWRRTSTDPNEIYVVYFSKSGGLRVNTSNTKIWPIIDRVMLPPTITQSNTNSREELEVPPTAGLRADTGAD